MNVNDTLGNVTNMLKSVVHFGLALMVVALVVDILFPHTTNIVGNMADFVDNFMSHGLVGLIALLVFVAIYDRS
jgi:hypothetical protein